MARTRHIPQTGPELTAEWFTETIGASLGATVEGVERERIGEGTGFMGVIYRCRLTWADTSQPRADLPSSVVAKMPAASNRAIGEAIQAFEREIVIYRDLGERFGVPMPRYYYAALDPESGGVDGTWRSVLVRKAARQGSQLAATPIHQPERQEQATLSAHNRGHHRRSRAQPGRGWVNRRRQGPRSSFLPSFMRTTGCRRRLPACPA